MGKPTRQGDAHDVTNLVDGILAKGVHARATDIHFEPTEGGLLTRFRVDGQLIDDDCIAPGLGENVVSRLKVIASLLTYRTDIPQEGSLRWAPNDATGTSASNERGGCAELRVATFPTIRGERAVVRVFRDSPRLQALDTLGLADEQVAVLRHALEQPSGMI